MRRLPTEHALSRRALLNMVAAGGVTAGLAACGVRGAATEPPQAAADASAASRLVRWANWPAYLDFDDVTQTYPTLERFQRETGITVTYAEDIDGNDTYYAKIQGQLRNGQDFGKDLIVLSNPMAGRVVRQGYMHELDVANIPNSANLVPKLRDVQFDPGRRYTLTYQSGFAGIGYHRGRVGRELRTVDDLWAPDLKGRVVVVDDLSSTVGLIMRAQGADITADLSGEAYMTGLAELGRHITSGQIRQVKGNSYIEDLRSGNAVAAIGWSGDLALLQAEGDPGFTFALPESGGTLWSDNFMIPVTSPNKSNAERLIDFYYDPAVAAEVAAYVHYICPVEGAREEMERIDPTLVDDPLIFPTDEHLANVESFRPLTPDEELTYSEAFQKVIGL